MSKWVNKFQTHAFNQSLEEVTTTLESIDISSITDENILIEISRLKKVTQYITEYIKFIEPDLNITNIDNTLKSFNDKLTQIKISLNQFLGNSSISYIQQANSHIDGCLTQLKTFHTILPKVSNRSLTSMLTSYNNTLISSLKKLI